MTDDPSPSAPDEVRLKLILGAAAVAVAGLALFVTLTVNDDDTDVATNDTTTTSPVTEPPISSTASVETTTSSAPVDDPYRTAVWPWADTSQRFDDPVEAARSFAVAFVGFADPVMGEFMQGDSRSGEVEIRPTATGPVSTVFLRQFGPGDTWWVLGSATENIEVTAPSALDVIAAPVTLTGRANAFEGNVNVTVRIDGQQEPIAEGFVTGMMGEMGPFESAQDFPNPGVGSGALVFRTLSAEDGSVWEAGVIRVAFAPN